MSHSYHPDVHEHRRADGCESCDAAAEDPFAFLDDAMLAALVRRLTGDQHSRSTAEAVAMNAIRDALNRFGRLAKLEPRAVAWLTRWGYEAAVTPVPASPPTPGPETAPEAVGTA